MLIISQFFLCVLKARVTRKAALFSVLKSRLFFLIPNGGSVAQGILSLSVSRSLSHTHAHMNTHILFRYVMHECVQHVLLGQMHVQSVCLKIES